MRQGYMKKDYERILKMEIQESALIQEKMQEAYQMIRNGGRKQKDVRQRSRLKRLIMGMSAAAAALVLRDRKSTRLNSSHDN